MKINTDCDGVAADFEAALCEAVGADLRERDSWDVFAYFTPEQAKAAREILSNGEFWANLPVIDGAKAGVSFLTTIGHELVWVTSPWEDCPNWEPIRRNWIRENFGDQEIIVDKVKHQYPADAFIDDKPAHVEDWQKANPLGKAYLYDQHYNRSFNWPRRFTWDKVKEIFG